MAATFIAIISQEAHISISLYFVSTCYFFSHHITENRLQSSHSREQQLHSSDGGTARPLGGAAAQVDPHWHEGAAALDAWRRRGRAAALAAWRQRGGGPGVGHCRAYRRKEQTSIDGQEATRQVQARGPSGSRGGAGPGRARRRRRRDARRRRRRSSQAERTEEVLKGK